MKWDYMIGASHTRVRVFMNGANCGDLCFRNEEFKQIRDSFPERQGLTDKLEVIHFIDDAREDATAG